MQPKLAMTSPGHASEQEAHRVSEEIVRLPDAPHESHARFQPAGVPAPRPESAAAMPRAVREVLASPGEPLDPATRAFMEPRFGWDFSRIRVHADSKAAESSRALNALAFAGGDHLVFAAGSYSPHSTSGRRLLAHELTHTLQQPGSAAGSYSPHSTSGRRLLAHELTHTLQQQPGSAAGTVQRLALPLNYEGLAGQINTAVRNLGTDEEAIYTALLQLNRDPESVSQLETTYASLYKETLMEALEGDLDEEELDYAKGLMGRTTGSKDSRQRLETATPTTEQEWDAQARRLKAAVEHRVLGIFSGTDEEAIFAVLTPLAGDANKVEAIAKAYARITKGPPTALIDALRDEMSGDELAYALRLLQVPDRAAGTQAELSSDQVLAVRNELVPETAAAAGPPGRWDGRVGAPNFRKNRDALKAKLRDALRKHLDEAMKSIGKKAAAAQLPMKALEGAVNAAVEITDHEYKGWYSLSAIAPLRAALRSGFQYTEAGGNLLNATDPDVRKAAGSPISAPGTALWMIEHDDPEKGPGAREHMKDHNFNPNGTRDGEFDWLSREVIGPFVRSPGTKAQLEAYDRFGFALQPAPGKMMIAGTAPGSSLASGDPPNLVDRRRLWKTWHVAVHEYIHNLAHPLFDKATSTVGSGVMLEGFTEYFSKQVVTKAAPVAHQNQSLVAKVEGGIFKPETTPKIVGTYEEEASYKAERTHVENLEKKVPGGDRALRAAYFQGHVEKLGIDPKTHTFATGAPASVDPALVPVPAGIADLADLSARTGVPVQQILAANSGLKPADPLPATLKLPGVRQHKVVAGDATATAPTETAEQIAAQNGVSVAALRSANPAANFATLKAGESILIPRH